MALIMMYNKVCIGISVDISEHYKIYGHHNILKCKKIIKNNSISFVISVTHMGVFN